MKPEPSKLCEHCRQPLKRKRYSTGNLEATDSFRRRRFCDRQCMVAHKGWHTAQVVQR